MRTQITPRRSLTFKVEPGLADWLEDEADRRLVGRDLLVDRALRLLREAIERAPDLVDLPPAPPGRGGPT